MSALAAVASYEDALGELAVRNSEVVVMTAENRASIRNLPDRLGDRFIDVGICEQTLIGTAAGLALRGRIPVVHALSAFLVMRAFEFIRTDVGIARLPVKLMGYAAGLRSEANGPTHQALEDVALMRGIPGMQVFCPADLEELVDSLPAIVTSPAPCYVRYHLDRRALTLPSPRPFAVGRAETVFEGRDVALLTYGFLLHEAGKARDLLEARGISTRLVNVRTLKPVDEEAILQAAGVPLVVTIEDHFETGGLYTVVAETLLRRGRTARVVPFAFRERWFTPGLLPDVLRKEGFDGHSLARRVIQALDREA